MNISVIGCGRWGSFLAWYADRLQHQVVLYGRESSQKMKTLYECRSNGLVTLEDSVVLTSDLGAAVKHAEILVLSIGAQSLRALMQQLSVLDLNDKAIVLCMKGIEALTGKRLTQIVEEYTPKTTTVSICKWRQWLSLGCTLLQSVSGACLLKLQYLSCKVQSPCRSNRVQKAAASKPASFGPQWKAPGFPHVSLLRPNRWSRRRSPPTSPAHCYGIHKASSSSGNFPDRIIPPGAADDLRTMPKNCPISRNRSPICS